MLTELNESPPIPIRNSCKIIIIFFFFFWLIPICFFSFFSCSILLLVSTQQPFTYECHRNSNLLMNDDTLMLEWKTLL